MAWPKLLVEINRRGSAVSEKALLKYPHFLTNLQVLLVFEGLMACASVWAPYVSLSLSLLLIQYHKGREHNPVPHAFHVGLCQLVFTTR